jgi:hypothetical protein
MERVWIIKNVENEKFFIKNWRCDDPNWSKNLNDATTFNSYPEASNELETNKDIQEGMYQIVEVIKKPEIDWDEEEIY